MHPRLPHAPSGADVVHVVEEPLFVLPIPLGFGPEDDPPGYTFIVRAENALGRDLHGPRWVESYRLGPPLNLPPPSSSSAKGLDARREARLLLQNLDRAIWQLDAAVARQAGADGPARPEPDPTKIPSLSRAKSARPNYRSPGDVDAAWADAYSSRVRYRSEALEAGIDPEAEEVEHRQSPQEILSDAGYERAWRRDQAVTEQWKLVVDVRRHLLRELQSGAISASVRPYAGGPWRALTPGDWNADLASLQRRFIYGAMDPDRPFPGRGKAWPSGWWIFIEHRDEASPSRAAEDGPQSEDQDAAAASASPDANTAHIDARSEVDAPPLMDGRAKPMNLQQAVEHALSPDPEERSQRATILRAIRDAGWTDWPEGTWFAIFGSLQFSKGSDPKLSTFYRVRDDLNGLLVRSPTE